MTNAAKTELSHCSHLSLVKKVIVLLAAPAAFTPAIRAPAAESSSCAKRLVLK